MIAAPARAAGADTRAVLTDWGVPRVEALLDSRAAIQSDQEFLQPE